MLKTIFNIFNITKGNSHSGHMLNKLRASVLGANDGIVSISCLILGVAGATSSSDVIFIAGGAGMMAGIISMSIGEYISVSSLRDAEEILLKKKKSKKNIKLNIDQDRLTNPMSAAFASAESFFLGALIPMTSIILFKDPIRIPAVFISGLIALIITGILSARISGASVLRATVRIVIGGSIAMLATYGTGLLFNISNL